MIRLQLKKLAVTAGTTAMLLFGLLAGTKNVSAEQLTAGELSVMTQSTATDTDTALLWLLAGAPYTQPQTINYNSSATASSWTGTLSGNYIGQALNLTYLGTINNTLSWNTAGSIGSSIVTGNGAISISYPTSSTFNLAFSDSLGYGGNTYTLNTSIPGSILSDGTIMFGSPGNEEVGNGEIGDPHWIQYSYYQDTDVISDIIIFPPIGPLIGKVKNVDYPTPPYIPPFTPLTGSFQETITLSPVPEPSTMMLVLLSGGLGAVHRLCRKCRRKNASA
jgi:hypothetical protein